MENLDFTISTITNNITFFLTKNASLDSSIIKINNENLSKNGELCFLHSLLIWKRLNKNKFYCNCNCLNILQHYSHIHDLEGEGKTNEQVAKEVFDLLISKSAIWPVKIEKCILREERVCIFFNRIHLTTNIIRRVIEQRTNYGQMPPTGKKFNLMYRQDCQSELTNARLHLLKDVAEKILILQGHELSESVLSNTIIFTTSSQCELENGQRRYICGVVKNIKSRTKETSIKWNTYIDDKINQLAKLNAHRFQEEPDPTGRDVFLKKLALATSTFELLNSNPISSIFCGHSENNCGSSVHAMSFVLYNTARIAAILKSYEEKKSSGEYPDLPNIEDIDFSQLDQEEEWELVYNFIFGYLQLIEDCLKYEPNFSISPQLICLFLFRFCRKFSAYYRRVRILMEGHSHLIPKIIARIYMLRALQIILENALAILNIKPVSRM